MSYKVKIASAMSAFACLLIAIAVVLSLATADRHNHVYDYTLEMKDDGSFDLVGVCTVDNCESPYLRQTNLTGVKLLSAVSPTCSAAGNRVYTYTVGNTTIKYTENIPASAHEYDFELVTSDGVNYINGRCKKDGCTNPNLFIRNVEDFTLVSSVPGNCFTPRKDTYVYNIDGEQYSFVTLVDEDVPHTLNGISAHSFVNDEGNYPVGIPGVKLFNNAKLPCGETTDGYFVCEVCKQVETVTVFRADHEFIYDEANVVAPTLSSAGKITLTCSNPECTDVRTENLPPVMNGNEIGHYTTVEKEATEINPLILKYKYNSLNYSYVSFEKLYEYGEPLEHEYEYRLEPNKTTSGKFNLVGVCHQPECTAPEICIENVPAEFVSDTSTCLTPGIITWRYEYNGIEILLEAIAEKPSDHSYSYDASNEETTKKPSGLREGEILLYCTTEGCDHTVTVTLPKLEIGVNAVKIDGAETDTYYIVEYTHLTEYNCKVVLRILIDKTIEE